MVVPPISKTPARTWPGGSPASMEPLGSSLNNAMLLWSFEESA